MLRAAQAALFIAIMALCSCSSSIRLNNDGLVRRLNNRGPVALSADNPYLAANLLLSREMEKSSEVKGFVKHRGAPAALEVTSQTFGTLTLNLFYPETREYYNFEELSDSWLISGPFRIPADKMKQVAVLTRNQSGEPKLAETLNPKNSEEPSPPSPRLDSSAQSNSIQEIIEASPKLAAEISPKGDLVHYVTWSGETLSILSRWYTLDRDNAARLARINNLRNPDSLSIGDSIIIPGYLLKNRIRLSQEALKKLGLLANN